MDLSYIQPIAKEPILFIKNKQILVVADLHIGIDSQLREEGLSISSQTKTMLNHLFSICEDINPKEIILLGDIKHNIPTSSIQERRDVRKFLDIIKEYATIHIIPGNHDGNIKKLSFDEINIHPSDGFIIENLGFVHGHKWPSESIMECERIIIGHTHPTVMFSDRLGYKTFEPCWIKGNLLKNIVKEKYPNYENSELLVMPAFNPLCGGVAINQEGITGPIGKLIDINNAQIFLIDGSFLGKVKDI